ncbi:MAG: hypothetical protein COZ57_10850 [Armatimonadetes bacterium CG_4_8_14_3_um_filter_66_20]|nr:MAG: hypothetical protein COZ57_10850 [Armatimonadetes bacterium CG_4_8_14_3_um_filter_66_20]
MVHAVSMPGCRLHWWYSRVPSAKSMWNSAALASSPSAAMHMLVASSRRSRSMLRTIHWDS